VANANNLAQVERWDTSLYTPIRATWSRAAGLRLPGVPQDPDRCAVVTEPLPTGTSMTMAVAADGGAFTTLKRDLHRGRHHQHLPLVRFQLHHLDHGYDFELKPA